MICIYIYIYELSKMTGETDIIHGCHSSVSLQTCFSSITFAFNSSAFSSYTKVHFLLPEAGNMSGCHFH